MGSFGFVNVKKECESIYGFINHQLGWRRLVVTIGLLELGRGHVPEGLEEAAAVAPRDPLEHRELDVFEPPFQGPRR
jgi:hypothetical protein